MNDMYAQYTEYCVYNNKRLKMIFTYFSIYVRMGFGCVMYFSRYAFTTSQYVDGMRYIQELCLMK